MNIKLSRQAQMNMLLYLSEGIIPIMLFCIIGTGVIAGRPVFDDFLAGAHDGMNTAVRVLPTLIGLMTAVGVLRSSGLLDAIADALQMPADLMLIPAAIVPVIVVRLISNSAAIGLVLDIFRTYGPDSLEGMMASVILGSTEAIVYTISIYFGTAKIRKTGWTVPGALAAAIAGIVASMILVTGFI